MSRLYPTLEDLNIDDAARAQVAAVQQVHHQQQQQQQQYPPQYAPQYPPQQQQQQTTEPSSTSLYSSLLLSITDDDYLGLDVSEQALAQFSEPMPLVQQQQHSTAIVSSSSSTTSSSTSARNAIVKSLPGSQAIASVTPKGDLGMVKAHIKQGVHRVILAKDAKGKLGLAVKAIDKGVFVSFVWSHSAASLAGVRFGDQILMIDGKEVAGMSDKKALDLLKKAADDRVEVIMRDRPWCRTITVVKDSTNHCGFIFSNGTITKLVKDTSATRNGLLINHRIIELNGRNVVGMPDKEMLQIIRTAPPSLTLTVMPSFVYKHLVKKIGSSLIKKYMDHSDPEI